MEMSVKERIEQFIAQKQISKYEFERACGLSNGYLRQLKKSPTADKIESIISAYPELSRTWLLTGEGEMLTGEGTTTPGDDATAIAANPYFDNATIQGGLPAATGMEQFAISQAAGFMAVPGVPNRVDIPFLRVRGDSMLDRDNPRRSIPDGAWIALQRVTSSIQWGAVYAIMTADGPIVKRLYPSERDGHVRCVSFNDEFPPFDLSVADIRGDIFKVIARVDVALY
jgi:phage repressor protein C with HTH and peptisase S24 domain